MTFHSGKRLRAIKLAAVNRCRKVSRAQADTPSQHRTLIDVLEPRLLFSAEHPLGLAVGPTDFQEHFGHLRDAEIASVTLDMLQALERESSENLTGVAQGLHVENTSNEVGGLEPSPVDFSGTQNDLTIDELPLDEGLRMMQEDAGDPLVVITVTTEDDSIDATDMSSFSNFNNGAGGDNLVSLREAIMVANADSSVDFIQLPSGTFRLDMDTGAWNDDGNLEGDLDLSGTYIIQGNSESDTTIEQTIENRRVFEVRSGSVTFSDMTIKGGSVTTKEDGSGDVINGGGVYIHDNEIAIFKNITFENNDSLGNGGALFVRGHATLENVTINGSDALKGAAIAIAEPGTAIVSDSEIRNNNVTDDGGGIYVNGRLELYDSVVDSNSAVSADAGDNTRGGGIWIGTDGEAIIEGTTISNNFATSDGGGIQNFGTLNLTDSGLYNNDTVRTGGGLRNTGEATLERTTVWGNTVSGSGVSYSGAGIYNESIENLTISYSTIIANNSTSWGGGLSSAHLDSGVNGAVNISDSVIINNTSQITNSGGGLLATVNTVTLTNTIVANNTASGSPNDVRGFQFFSIVFTVNSGGFNLVESSSNFDEQPTDIIGVDPGFSISLDANNNAAISVSPNSATIDSGSTAGTGNKTIAGSIVGDTPNIGGYTINSQNGMVFWSADSGAIYRSDASFTYSQKIIDGISAPLDIEVDDVNHRVYWLDSANHEIKSAKYDGTDIVTERLVDEDAVAFALDIENQRFFIAASDATSRIIQYFENDTYNSDAEERAGQLIYSDSSGPTDIELDQDSDILYWAEEDGGAEDIMSVVTQPYGVDPTVPAPQIVINGSTLVRDPYALAIKDSTDEVFWSEPGEGHVGRFDGGAKTLDTDTPQALAYDTLNDRLLVSNDNSEVYWVDSNLDSASAKVGVPETATRVAFAVIQADEPATNNIPEITSANTVSALENQTSVLTVISTDADSDTPTYSIVGGGDAILFDIDSASGDLTFKLAPDFETPGDVGANNIYNVDVQVSDGNGGTDTQSIAVTVTNENEAPVITSANTDSALENQTSVLTVTSTDEDLDTPAYSIVGGADAILFDIDATNGDLKFKVAPNFEAPDDDGSNNVYDVDVQVSDGNGGANTQSIVVTVTNEDESPVVVSDVLTTINENETGSYTVSSSDVEGGAPVYTLSGGADRAMFLIDSSSGELKFLVAPDFEEPGDSGLDNFYNVTVQVADADGDTATQNVTVSVTNVDEIPVMTPSLDTDAAENQLNVVTVSSSNVDGGAPVYTLVAGADEALFTIDGSSGELTFITAKNFEDPTDVDVDNDYEVMVQVADADGDAALQAVTVSVTNVDETPVMTPAIATDAAENQISVITVSSSDVDGGSPVYTLVRGADEALFTIDSISGELTFLTAKNFEDPTDADVDNDYEVTVQVADADGDTAIQAVTVSVTNVDEAPVIASAIATDAAENQLSVVTVSSTDVDGGSPVYTLVGGADQALFAIDGSSGELTFVTARNFEDPTDADVDNDYEVTVQVADADGDTAIQAVTVSVTNVDETPVMAPAIATDAAENQLSVVTVSSSNVDGGAPVYTLVAGADEALFTIDGSSGELTFITAKNFEDPTDTDVDNDYEVTVQVADANGDTAIQVVTVSVTNVDETPVMASAIATDAAENQLSVVTVSSTDVDGGSPVYTLVGGADEALFTIDSSSGELTFLTAKNFEDPTDADVDNDYEVTVQVADADGDTAIQAVTVSVTNVDETPVMTPAIATDAAENQLSVVTVSSTDVDGGSPVYTLVGGADQALFAIDGSSGELTFLTARNFEDPTDADVDNDYEVTVQVADADGDTAIQAVTVSVTNVDETPVMAAAVATDAAENQLSVITVSSSDVDGGSPVYTLVGGADEALFTIDGSSGELTFLTAKNFEDPTDADLDNDYEVTVQVTDADGDTAKQAVTVSVTNVDETPVMTPAIATDAAENQLSVVTVNSSDVDGGAPSYSIIGGIDAVFFDVDNTSGALTFRTAPNFEDPTDADTDNVYDVMVQVADSDGQTTTQAIAVSVTNVDETPVMTPTIATTAAENQLNVTTVSSTNVDGGSPVYTLIGGADEALFTIDGSSGELTFLTAKNFEDPTDANIDNDYEVTVQVADADGDTATQAVTVSVTNVDEIPVMTPTIATTAAENQLRVVTVSSSDVDGGAPVYTLIGGADEGLFTIDSSSGELSFLAAKNFEDPTDADTDNIYDVTVQVADSDGQTAAQVIAVSVTNVDETPVMTPAIATDAAENQLNVVKISSSDVDGGVPAYSIIGGIDAALFDIDSTSGELTFRTAPNFEEPIDADGNNVYQVTVQVADDDNETASQVISVTVTDVDEVPVLSGSVTKNIDENQTTILTVTSSDVDGGAPEYSVSGGDDAALFVIDPASGELTFQIAPDFEAPDDDDGNNVYEVSVQVADGDGQTATLAISVIVDDIDEIPVLTSDVTTNIVENQTNVLTVSSADVDGGAPVYSITGGADASLFDIDSSSGELTFRSAPNFEAPADVNGKVSYQVTVQVADEDNETATQTITVTVTDVDEIPVINAAATTIVEENQTSVLTVVSSNVDGGTPEYSISGGADAAVFAIDSATGVLTFLAAPDSENTADADGNNEYEVTVQVTDGDNDVVNQTISVAVISVNEDPVITSASLVSTAENQANVFSIIGSDEDGDSPVYEISGGVDADLFAIDSSSGELSFQVLPDFENPRDTGENNQYDVTIQVTDGIGGLSTQTVTISVVDQNDVPVINRQLSETILDSSSVITVGGDTFSDQDSDALVYSMSLLDGRPLPDWLSYNPDTTELSLGVAPSQEENAQLLLTANDSRGGLAQMIFDVRFTPDIEPQLQAATPIPEPLSVSEFDTLDSGVSLSLKSSQPTAVSENGYSTSELVLASEDSIEPVASVSAETMTDILSNGFSAIVGSDDNDVNQRAVLRDNVLSEYLSGQAVDWDNAPDAFVKINVFDDSVNIASIFAMAQQQDPEMFSALSDGFDKQREELDSQINASRGVIGSAITTTSGLSVGYILYLLRGGAIMSSMLTSLPAWRFVDPLPILGSLEGSLDGDGESLQSIVGGAGTTK